MISSVCMAMWEGAGADNMPLTLCMPIFKKNNNNKARTEECLKQKFPLFTSMKLEIFVCDISQLVSDEIFC